MDAVPPDLELVRAAQAGDVTSLGLLLAKHRSSMYAVAVAALGSPNDAEDAVQDAAIVALGNIGSLRGPTAIGPWLRMVVRNICRAALRKPSAIPAAELPDTLMGKERRSAPDPAEVLEHHALGDWVRTALEDLSPALRLVALLRYFTDVTSYEEIAELCAIPVGTVRSRLNQARRKLAEALLNTADRPHCDARALTAVHRRLAEETVASVHRGGRAEALSTLWSPTAQVTWPTGVHTDVKHLSDSLARDVSYGIRHQILNVVASREVVIWEAALHSPPGHRFPFPSGLVWVHHLDRGRINRVRLYHPRSAR